MAGVQNEIGGCMGMCKSAAPWKVEIMKELQPNANNFVVSHTYQAWNRGQTAMV